MMVSLKKILPRSYLSTTGIVVAVVLCHAISLMALPPRHFTARSSAVMEYGNYDLTTYYDANQLLMFIGNSGVKITRIEIDTIANLPPGITYSTDTNIFFPDTMYCVLISGTPTDTGTFYIDISVIPYIWSDILGEVKMNPQHDSTSVFIVVSEPSFLPERKGTGFSLINPRPNPFRESVKIGFTTADPKNAELVVYDLSGQVIYRERLYSRPGKNYFRFTGAALYPGVYPYFVSTAGKRLAGKLVKLH